MSASIMLRRVRMILYFARSWPNDPKAAAGDTVDKQVPPREQ